MSEAFWIRLVDNVTMGIITCCSLYAFYWITKDDGGRDE